MKSYDEEERKRFENNVFRKLAEIKNDLQKIMDAIGIVVSPVNDSNFNPTTTKEDDMESVVSSVSDLVYSKFETKLQEDKDDEAEAKDDYRSILSEWEDSDFSDDLVPMIFPAVCEWIETYGTIFKPGSQMRLIIKNLKKRIAETKQNDDEKKKSIVSDFLIGKPSETICKRFEIFDGGCESLEALLLRESAVDLHVHIHSRNNHHNHQFRKR